jgi:hypothetical protein
MQTPRVHDLLLARAFASNRGRISESTTGGGAISRRQFLSSTGSLAPAAYAVSFASLTPQVVRQGTSVVVFYAGRRWTIDATLFGAARVRHRRQDGEFVIELTDAYLPGTDLDVSFRARLYERSSGWYLSLLMPAQALQASVRLGTWLAGEEPLSAAVSTTRVSGGGSAMSFASPPTMTVAPSFGFRFSDALITLQGPLSGEGRDLTLDVHPPAEGMLREALHGIRAAATVFTLEEPRLEDGAITIGADAAARAVSCCADAPTRIIGELFSTEAGRQGIVVLEAPMRVFHGTEERAPDDPAQLRLERAALMSTSGRDVNEVALAGRVSRASHVVEIGGCQLTICGDDERPFYAQARGGDIRDVTFRARVEQVWVPVASADAAIISVPQRPVEIRLVCPETPPHEVEHNEDPSASLVVLGRNPYVIMPLQGAALTLRRGVDLVNLSFEFKNCYFKIENGNPFVCRRKPARLGDAWPEAWVTVTFPPQHIGEESRSFPNPKPCLSPTPPFPDVSAARLSAPSRVAFKLSPDPKLPQWVQQPLSIEGLTDWSDLALRVSERALEPDASFEAQMSVAGIDKDTALDDFPKTLASQLEPPDASRTALTMSGRLVLSPSTSARWLTPRSTVDPKAAPLWRARLDATGRKTVRAIWSYYMTREQFFLDIKNDSLDDLLPLSAKHHWEIVGQSAVYGLPALRRITDVKNDPSAQLPRSRVIRPDPDFKSLCKLDCLNSYKEKDSGIALPKPFDDADLILTSLGGSFVGDWKGEPPHLLYLPGQVGAIPFSLERLRYWSQLGRDIRVEAVDKGFMLPLGIRCSFVTIVERRFFLHAKRHEPTAYLIRRSFIVFGKPDKQLPGVNQPFASRDFPAQQITMLTRKTPDLTEPKPDSPQPVGNSQAQIGQGGYVVFPGDATPYKIFWPRTANGLPGTPGDVLFKWSIDDNPTPVESNLLFIENAALSVESVIKKVVDYYRTMDDGVVSLRTARLGGVRRRYAPAAADGDTSFDTDSWLLSTRGRLVTKNGESESESFQMDGRMEGADQPPFYPVVRNASVNVQSLDRLLGRPQGLINVGFTPQYVRHGFNTSLNPSEIFLSIVGPDIALDVTNQGAAAGGLAKPNALVAALSRKKGPVGGARGASPPAATGSQSVGVETSYSFSHALAGRFEPSEFLGGLGTAKLLGLIPLDVVLNAIGFEGAPKLLEQIGYGVNAVQGEVIGLARAVFQTPLVGGQRLTDLIDGATNSLRMLPGGIRFEDLYPTLYQALKTLNQSVKQATQLVASSPSLSELGDKLTEVVRDGKALLAEIERTVREPMPAIAQAVLDTLATAWSALTGDLTQQYLNLGRAFQKTVSSNVETFCVAALCSEAERSARNRECLSDVLFGTDASTLCHDLVDAPVDVLRRVESALFADQFTRPILTALQFVRGMQAEVRARIAWARAQFRDLVRAGLIEAETFVADRLQKPLEEAGQKTLLDDLFAKVEKAIEDAAIPDETVPKSALRSALTVDTPNTEFDRIIEKLDALRQRILSSGDLVRAIIADHPELLVPKRQSDATKLVQDFTRILEERVRAAVEPTIIAEIDQVRTLVVSTVQQARGQAIERILKAVDQIFDSIAASTLFMQVTAAARAVSAWCNRAADGIPPVFNVADALAQRVIGTTDQIRESVETLADQAGHIGLPSGLGQDARERLDRVLASLRAAVQQLNAVTERFNQERAALAKVRDDIKSGKIADVCATPEVFLGPAGRLMALRREAVERLRDVLNHTVAADELLRAAAQQPIILAAADEEAEIYEVSAAFLESIRELFLRITSLGEVSLPGVWNTTIDSIEAFVREPDLQKVPAYARQVTDKVTQVEDEARRLTQDIANAADPARLRALAEDVITYAVAHDKRLAALVLQTVALTRDLEQKLDTAVTKILQEVVAPVVLLHRGAVDVLKRIETALNEPTLHILINPEIVSRIADGRAEVDRDLQQLEQIAQASSVIAAFPLVRALIDDDWRPKQPALVRVVAVLADLAESILKGNLGQLVNLSEIKRIIGTFEQQLRDAIAQLIPTSVHLSYEWDTALRPFPSDGSVFLMTQSGSDDLQLRADIRVDLMTGTRSAAVRGAMRPFQIHLLGSFDIAIISFSGATFVSQNGSAPHFQADVQDVAIGTLIKFIKPLQKWLSPSGNGFYVKPVVNPPGIEAGYGFDCDVIPLGAILFVNVSLGVSAFLPFTDSAAMFKFNFATPDRPFMIVAPPYGGGGYVSLTANARQIVEFRLSFIFGAVVPIKFGPLSAQGRVVAGVYVISKSTGERTIGALVEAAGEGHIACFSISVCLRVGLEQQTGPLANTLKGFAEFSFEFSIGIASITFKFQASYTARNDKQGALTTPGGTQAAKLATGQPIVDPCKPDPKQMVKYVVVVPTKASHWDKYQQRISMELL